MWRSLLTRMARDYPEALRFPYLVAKEASSQAMGDSELDSILALDALQEKLLRGFSRISVPEIQVMDALNSSGSSGGGSVASKLEKLKEEFLSQTDICGSLYRDCAKKFLSKKVGETKFTNMPLPFAP